MILDYFRFSTKILLILAIFSCFYMNWKFLSAFLVIVQYKIICYTRNGVIFLLLQNDYRGIAKQCFLLEISQSSRVLAKNCLCETILFLQLCILHNLTLFL